jgi:hypothetical protein
VFVAEGTKLQRLHNSIHIHVNLFVGGKEAAEATH